MLYLDGLVLQKNNLVMGAVNTNTVNKRALDMLDKDARHTTAFDRPPWVESLKHFFQCWNKDGRCMPPDTKA